jgi:hypothetical protein
MAKRNRKIVNLEDIKDFKKYKSMMQPDLIKKDLIRSLAREGKRLISAAYATRTYEKRTGYLHDSYVSAVFKNGVCLKDTIRFVGTEMSRMSMQVELSGTSRKSMDLHMSGREAAEKFIAKYQFAKGRKSGFALVIAAAAYYSGILEARSYKVISHVFSELENLQKFGVNGDSFIGHFGEETFSGSHIKYHLDGSSTNINIG